LSGVFPNLTPVEQHQFFKHLLRAQSGIRQPTFLVCRKVSKKFWLPVPHSRTLISMSILAEVVALVGDNGAE